MNTGELVENFIMEDIPFAKLRGIYQYWLDIKADRDMPSRADFNPVDIPNLLAHVSLVDVEHGTGRYKFRLIGTETVRAMGFEPTGQYLDENPLIMEHLKPRYDWLVQNKNPYVVTDKLNWSENSFLRVFSVGLPLGNSAGQVEILLFGSVYTLSKDQAGASPL